MEVNVPNTWGFYNDKTGIADLVKYMAFGNGIEKFVQDGGLFTIYCKEQNFYDIHTCAKKQKYPFLFCMFTSLQTLRHNDHEVLMEVLDELEGINTDTYSGYPASLRCA